KNILKEKVESVKKSSEHKKKLFEIGDVTTETLNEYLVSLNDEKTKKTKNHINMNKNNNCLYEQNLNNVVS
ncbi:hypothetical protein HEP_00534400, partial [Hepatocystis sp. ex Piliocolobus tephrosceles]